ncbi:SRPBCC family protein [Streptomyces iconiensis]|uniref:SRPBCC domain-containing protein n=1 Tax=Streptomyces iconiensis TaxID=1384038 RepID=A0ABT6ZYY1_9ACTN|nr:SRPBCC family protein [Streptomyces iconiensis]MDJ1134282.1 SRPBCC domain-containing protein [Streptomyces iconiensis]
MRLSNAVPVKAPAGEVFALVNDVERVVSCMPGAALEGRDGDAWRGRVKVKVGPITAAYAGTVRFLEVDEERRTLRVQARGADTHGSGDAEAAVRLEVTETPEGSELRLETDLVIRGKIAQFGKGAVATVSDKILQQFARNLGALLDQDRAHRAAPAPDSLTASAPVSGSVPVSGSAPEPVPGGAGRGTYAAHAPRPQSEPRPRPESQPQPQPHAEPQPALAAYAAGQDELNGLSMIVGPALSKYGPVVGAFAFGLFEGWLLGRVLTREKHAARCGR